MTIQPIFSIGLLLMGFVAAVGATGYYIFRNGHSISEKIFTMIRLSVIYLLVFIIGLRPVSVATDFEFSTKNLDVLFVVDTTISMWALDYDGGKPRMEGVRKDIDYILGELAGSNFGLVTFDDTAHVLSPFTQDLKYIEDTVDILERPDIEMATGSNLSVPYSDIKALLESSDKKDNRKAIVFYFSDGEKTNQNEDVSYKELAQYIDAGAVLGYGTSSGGRMKNGYTYIYNEDGSGEAISRIDEESLKRIAEELGVEYLNENLGNAALSGRIEMIKQQSTTIVERSLGAERYVDTYYWFALALAVMLIFETALFAGRGRL